MRWIGVGLGGQIPGAIRMVQIAVEVGAVRFASGRAGAESEFVVVEWWGV